MNIGEQKFKKLLLDMSEEELYEMLKELNLNKTESMNENRVKKVRERSKKKNTTAFFQGLTTEEKKQLIETIKNASS